MATDIVNTEMDMDTDTDMDMDAEKDMDKNMGMDKWKQIFWSKSKQIEVNIFFLDSTFFKENI